MVCKVCRKAEKTAESDELEIPQDIVAKFLNMP
jgi:hypothetical protein